MVGNENTAKSLGHAYNKIGNEVKKSRKKKDAADKSGADDEKNSNNDQAQKTKVCQCFGKSCTVF